MADINYPKYNELPDGNHRFNNYIDPFSVDNLGQGIGEPGISLDQLAKHPEETTPMKDEAQSQAPAPLPKKNDTEEEIGPNQGNAFSKMGNMFGKPAEVTAIEAGNNPMEKQQSLGQPEGENNIGRNMFGAKSGGADIGRDTLDMQSSGAGIGGNIFGAKPGGADIGRDMLDMQSNGTGIGGNIFGAKPGGTELPLSSDNKINEFNENIKGPIGSFSIGGTTDGTATMALKAQNSFHIASGNDQELIPADTSGFGAATVKLNTNQISGQTVTGRVEGTIQNGNVSISPYAEKTLPWGGQPSHEITQPLTTQEPASQNNIASPSENQMLSMYNIPQTPKEGTKIGGNLKYANADGLNLTFKAEKSETTGAPSMMVEQPVGNTTDGTMMGMMKESMAQPTTQIASPNQTTEKTSLETRIGTETEVGSGLLNTNASLKKTMSESGEISQDTQGYGLGTTYQGRNLNTNISYDKTNTTSSDLFSKSQQESSNLNGTLGIRANGFGASLSGQVQNSETAGDLETSSSSIKNGAAKLSYQQNDIRGYIGAEKNINQSTTEFLTEKTDGTTANIGASIRKPNGLQGGAEIKVGEKTTTTTLSDPYEMGTSTNPMTTAAKNVQTSGKFAYVPQNGVGLRLNTTYGYETPREQMGLDGTSISTGGSTWTTNSALTLKEAMKGKSNVMGEVGATTSFGDNTKGNVSLFGNATYTNPNWQIAANAKYQVYGNTPQATTLMPNNLPKNDFRVGVNFSKSLGI